MASIKQLVSEIAHATGQPYNQTLRNNIRESIIHERNERVRRTYERNGYLDETLQQRFTIELVNVNDGDQEGCDAFTGVMLNYINVYRSKNRLPKPVRLSNGYPFQSVSTIGSKYGRTISKVNEKLIRFKRKDVLGRSIISYDYINGYIYIFTNKEGLSKIVVRSAFEYPMEIPVETYEGSTYYDDDFLLPDDMASSIKDTIFKRDYLNITRDNKVHNNTSE